MVFCCALAGAEIRGDVLAGMAGKTHLHDLTLPRSQHGDVAGRIPRARPKSRAITRPPFSFTLPNPRLRSAPVPERITQMARVPHAVAIERNKKSNWSPAP
jgi:hypothetical protein